MRFRISKLDLEEVLQTFKDYIKEQKENYRYLTVKEARDFDAIERYIEDSISNEIIREKITFYNRVRRNTDSEEVRNKCENYIEVLKEVLGE